MFPDREGEAQGCCVAYLARPIKPPSVRANPAMELLPSLKLYHVTWYELDKGAQTGKVESHLVDTQ